MMIFPSELIHICMGAVETAGADFLRVAFTVAVCTIAVLAGIFMTVYLFGLIYGRHRRGLAVHRWLQIENQGNTSSIFRIHPDAGRSHVSPAVYYRERPLECAVQEISASVISPAQPAAQRTNNIAAPSPAQGSYAGNRKESAAASAKEAKKKAMRGINFGRKLGGIVGALGSMLPGDAGKALKDQSTLIQGYTQKATRTIEEPAQKKEEMEHIRQEIMNLGGKKPQADQTQPASPETSNDAPNQAASIPSSDAKIKDDTHALPAKANKTTTGRWVTLKGIFQTPAVNSGEKMRLKLVLTPSNIYRSTSVPLCIQSQQLITAESGELQTVNSSETWQTIQVAGLPLSKTIWNILLGISISAVNILWVTLVIRWFIGSYI